MGTRISISALHRERLRLTGNEALPGPPLPKKMSLDLDYGTMEFKSLIPPQNPPKGSAFVLHTSTKSLEQPDSYDTDDQESITDSLLERFDNMESENTEPERQIVSVILTKDNHGRLGLKIAGTPSGIYVEEIDRRVAIVNGDLRCGDRIVAINGRSLENVAYSGALELIKKSGNNVKMLVSQIQS